MDSYGHIIANLECKSIDLCSVLCAPSMGANQSPKLLETGEANVADRWLSYQKSADVIVLWQS